MLVPLVSSPMPIHVSLLASCFLLRRSWLGKDTDDNGEGVGLLRRARRRLLVPIYLGSIVYSLRFFLFVAG
jgi:hypothetical protein